MNNPKLNKLLKSALNLESEDSDLSVSGVSCDTRELKGGEIFCCIKGMNFDGNEFVVQAIEKGAVCLIVEKRLELDSNILQIEVQNVRNAMALLACEFFSNPAIDMSMIGVTGTNGKTTVSNLIAQISNHPAVALGTLSKDFNLTTPDSPHLQSELAKYLKNGTELIALEVSSHSLAQHRVDGIKFDLAVFLNLSQDHLDYHHNLKDYFAEKAKLFDPCMSKLAVINTDTNWGEELLKLRVDAVPFSIQDAEIISSDFTGSEFIWQSKKCSQKLVGTHNVVNSIAALTALQALGEDMDLCIEKLAEVPPIKGRFEVISTDPVIVIVDYAHSPDALEVTLQSLRNLEQNLIVVFGCGGEREKQKRSEMGKVASKYCDTIILTSDNSRSEEDEDIIQDIISGVDSTSSDLKVETNRRAAIELAFSVALDSTAKPKPTILIAGKGHETTQTTKQGVQNFNDAEVVKELLLEMEHIK